MNGEVLLCDLIQLSSSFFHIATGNESLLMLHYSMTWCLPSSSGDPSPPGSNGNSPPSAPEPSQTVSKLLLLSIFSVAARYLDESASEPMDKIWDAGCDYLTQARTVLGTS